MVAARRTVEVDPVYRVVHRALGRALQYAGRVEEGIEQMRRTIELDQSWPQGWETLSFALLEAGGYDEALETLLE